MLIINANPRKVGRLDAYGQRTEDGCSGVRL